MQIQGTGKIFGLVVEKSLALVLTILIRSNSGAVVLSGFINAAKIASQAAGTCLEEQRILFFGAGSAGIGVAKQLVSFFTLLGLTEEEAKRKIYVSTPQLFICDSNEPL